MLSFKLVDQIKLWAETIHRYRFEAERALQRWTFDVSRPSLPFHYGWVDPDIELELEESRDPNLTEAVRKSRREKAITAYLTSLLGGTSDLSYLKLRTDYDTSLQNLRYARLTKTLTDKQVKEMAAPGGTTVTLDIQDIPIGVRERSHVENVFLYVSVARTVKVEMSSQRRWRALVDGKELDGAEASQQVLIESVGTVAAVDLLVEADLSRLRTLGPSSF